MTLQKSKACKNCTGCLSQKTMWSAEDEVWRNQLIFIVCIYLDESTLMAVIIQTFFPLVFLDFKILNLPNLVKKKC